MSFDVCIWRGVTRTEPAGRTSYLASEQGASPRVRGCTHKSDRSQQHGSDLPRTRGDRPRLNSAATRVPGPPRAADRRPPPAAFPLPLRGVCLRGGARPAHGRGRGRGRDSGPRVRADRRVDLRVGSLAAVVARALAVGVAPAPGGAAPGSVARCGGAPGRRFGVRPTASPGRTQARDVRTLGLVRGARDAVWAAGDRHRARVVQAKGRSLGLTRTRAGFDIGDGAHGWRCGRVASAAP